MLGIIGIVVVWLALGYLGVLLVDRHFYGKFGEPCFNEREAGMKMFFVLLGAASFAGVLIHLVFNPKGE